MNDLSWFPLKVLNNKKNGVYVELGSSHPINGNNTYTLETQYGWTGLSIDIEEKMCDEFNNIRKNKSVCADALTFNYLKHFEENNFPKQIDYLQVDVDEGYTLSGRARGNPASSLLALISLPLNQYRFSIIMFEHDELIDYKFNSIKNAQREILYSLGYSLVQQYPSEDWWIDPTVIPYSEYKRYFMARQNDHN